MVLLQTVKKQLFKLPPAFFGIIGVCILAVFYHPSFLSVPFMLILLRQAAALGITALGQTFCVVNKSLDLSVGATITLVNIVITDRYWTDSHVALIIGVGILVGTLVGMLNGALVTVLRASSVVITIGTSLVLTGIGYIISNGAPGNQVHTVIKTIGRGRYEGIPIAGLIWIGFTIIAYIILRKLIVGRHVYAMGDNPSSAYFSGIPIDKTLLFSHVFCGFAAGLAGVVLSGLVGVGSLNLGADYVLSSIAAVILGGAVFGGGRGGAFGTFLGTMLLIMILNLLTVFGVDEPGKLIFQGLIIVISAGIYQYNTKQTHT